MRVPFVVVPAVNAAQRDRFHRHMDSAASG